MEKRCIQKTQAYLINKGMARDYWSKIGGTIHSSLYLESVLHRREMVEVTNKSIDRRLLAIILPSNLESG